MKAKIVDSPEVSDLKKRIMRTTCFLLYSIEEFAVLNYILNISDDKPEIKNTEISNMFADGEKLLDKLKMSKMIQSKDSNTTYFINHDYFKMIPAVHK